ncbi:MAG TPA: hypothetical protein VL687_02940 [Methylomirabilota bacterium]|nr:hypothetical protein [Methylomirabilota bacterium]
MLVTLGDAQLAERVAGFALAAGAGQAAALRHPERAAAWLRARTLRALREQRRFRRSAAAEDRRATLAQLGVGDAAYRGLASLDLNRRAALVASGIERFDPIDVETILNEAPAATRRVVAEARRRYLRFAGGSADADQASAEEPMGELADRVREVASRAFSIGEVSR